MSTFVEAEHKRAAAGTFAAHSHGLPAVSLPAPQLLDADQLTGVEASKLEEHLADLMPGSDQTNGEFYDSLAVTHLAQAIVYGRRGAPPQLLWQLHVKDDVPITVPPFVAKACTAPDGSEPAVALRYKRNRAEVARNNATDERARRAGRTDRDTYRALRSREDAATEKFLEANDAYESALASLHAPAAAERLARWNSDELVQLRGSGYLTTA